MCGLDIFNLSDGKSVRTFYLEFYSSGLCRRALRAAFQAISLVWKIFDNRVTRDRSLMICPYD